MYLSLAWRNIWRNKRRSLITILSITFAVLLACIMRSLQLGSYARMIETSVRFYTGYIQIHKHGYWADRIIDNTFTLDSSVLQTVRGTSGVTRVVPRLESFALAAYENKSKGALLTGIDPENENELTRLREKLTNGEYLNANDEGILLGEGLAHYLNAAVGDTITLIGQGYHGASAAGLFVVRGLVKFPLPQQNDQVAYVTLSKAQWFYAADQQATALSLLIDHPDNTNAITGSLRSQLDTTRFEIMAWEELLPELVQSIELDNVSGKVMLWILYIVIGFGMFGTYLMMTAERQYEFSVMIAVGMRRWRLQGIVFLEILLMTIVGVVTGIALSLPILTWFYHHPIRFADEAAKAIETFGVEAVYSFSLDPVIFTNQAYAIFIMAIILSAYPIQKIQRLNVVESMRP